jgi:hypothetical protein
MMLEAAGGVVPKSSADGTVGGGGDVPKSEEMSESSPGAFMQ